MRKKLFLDMDGTIAKFYEDADCLELMFMPGFFVNLRPYFNVVDGIRVFLRKYILRPEDIFVVSAADQTIFDQVVEEKRRWLRVNCGFVPEENCIFIAVGENKAEAVQKKIGEISKDFILLDDYNQHLHDWEKAGGTSVKLVNEINDRGSKGGSLWSGKRIRYDFTADRICEELIKIIEE